MLNKIHLADCYQFIKTIPSDSIDCIYTDPPYLFTSGGKSKKKIGNRVNKVINELKGTYEVNKGAEALRYELNVSDLTKGFKIEILNEFIRVMKKDKINILIWHSLLQKLDLLKWFSEFTKCTFDELVWYKTNAIPKTNNQWLQSLEYCFHFRHNVKLNNGYDLKTKVYTSATNKQDKADYDHPTIKPLAMVRQHLLHVTKPGDIILDPFAGSGTTCIAASEIDRQFIGIEINKRYYDTAVNRMNGINIHGQQSIFTNFEEVN